MDTLATTVGLLVALSIASERLVEIVKGLSSFLRIAQQDEKREATRRMLLHVLAVAAGIATAFLARPALPTNAFPVTDPMAVLALGLLASGGSGFWNAVLGYVLQVKNQNRTLAEEKKFELDTMRQRYGETQKPSALTGPPAFTPKVPPVQV